MISKREAEARDTKKVELSALGGQLYLRNLRRKQDRGIRHDSQCSTWATGPTVKKTEQAYILRRHLRHLQEF